ncbi:Fur family transcriptional regulator [Levilactobacillus zymae]|uniref:Peroxide stress regulator PerR, FUR family n=1 Tax=Levilactobacillus zymae TaxID=267363 RepID=A0A1Y6K0S9_9LACO|nr:Fur family transcriptional regulator [Levilactobacillus zymae]KRL11175.1 Fe2+ Zn2+ uptake regulation protein [Levilactobacillus zymae DSM 19395]MDT6981236.1 Fur family transcriptional regulator [Levilactobacillus zymae]QFR60073.1 transcriptional repressor [Levilactobacillus zymae]SMS14952.1 Peroxide stress regulator PerR, FUR family [Levilactobacillus zymae]GEO71492.1 transcriptional repressor [Levilactobacillus zymae]
MAQPNQLLAQALKTLKDHHIRVTPQRRVILTYLVNHHNHPAVETIYTALAAEQPNLSMATIYNTLNLLVDLGIVIELPNDNGGVRYDFYGQPHYHVICENCGKITDVFAPDFAQLEQQLNREASEQTGYLVTSNHVEVYGLCPECQQKLHIDPARKQWAQGAAPAPTAD